MKNKTVYIELLKKVLHTMESGGRIFICNTFIAVYLECINYETGYSLDNEELMELFPEFADWIIKIGIEYSEDFEWGDPWNMARVTKIPILKEYIKELEE